VKTNVITVPRLLEKYMIKFTLKGPSWESKKLIFWAIDLGAMSHTVLMDFGMNSIKIARKLIFSKWKEGLEI
jgi:long-chain acyl-CoA synthetase